MQPFFEILCIPKNLRNPKSYETLYKRTILVYHETYE